LLFNAALIFGFWLVDGGEWFLSFIQKSKLGDLGISSVAKQYLTYVCLFSSFTLGIQLLTKITWIMLGDISIPGVDNVESQIRQTAPIQASLIDQVLFVLLTAIGIVMIYYELTRTTKHEYHEFKAKSTRRSGFGEGGYQTESRLATEQILSAGAVLVSSLVLYATFVVILEMTIGLPFVSLPDTLVSLPLTTFVGSLFPLYFVVGIVWQFNHAGRNTKQLLEQSTQQIISYKGTEIPVQVFNHDDYYATSFTADGDDYIVLSSGLLSAVDESTAAAFAAHEAGHIHHGDTRLSRWLTLGSLPLLVGQNVLYDIIDFHHREHRADQYAAERLNDKQPVMDALEFLRNRETRDALSQDFAANAAPTFSHSKIETALSRPFELFFGGFAVSDSHPSYTERKQYLRTIDV
jgi:Zn-dependent protease with chaperone function